MWPDRVSNPGPPTYESGTLPTALCGPAATEKIMNLGDCDVTSEIEILLISSCIAGGDIKVHIS